MKKYNALESEKFKSLPDEDKAKVKKLQEEIDLIFDKFSEEYLALSKESEELYDKQESLKQKYRALERKSGLSKLFEEVSNVYSK